MSKYNFAYLLLCIAIMQLAAIPANAQRRTKYIPTDGFWQLVNTPAEKEVTTVQFYNNNRKLVYEEKITGVSFNLKKIKTLRWLKKGLEKALVAWNANKETLYDRDWVAVIVHNRQ